MFFLGHSLIIINWMKFLTAIKRFILHKNPIHNIRDRGFQRLEQKNQVLHGTVTSADIDFSMLGDVSPVDCMVSMIR